MSQALSGVFAGGGSEFTIPMRGNEIEAAWMFVRDLEDVYDPHEG